MKVCLACGVASDDPSMPCKTCVQAKPWISKATSLFNSKRNEEVIAACDSGLAIAPNAQNLLRIKVLALKNLGRDGEAQDCLRRIFGSAAIGGRSWVDYFSVAVGLFGGLGMLHILLGRLQRHFFQNYGSHEEILTQMAFVSGFALIAGAIFTIIKPGKISRQIVAIGFAMALMYFIV